MANDGRDVAATSKPRGNYLDPLKACALSGENGVPAGKSESATFSKYNGIIRQSRRNATRASVLNDVERSRFDAVVKRMENEHVYHTAVLDRQKRQFRKSLQVLEKDRRAVKRYFDRGGNWVATPLKLVEGFSSTATTKKRNKLGSKGDPLPPITDPVAAVHDANLNADGGEPPLGDVTAQATDHPTLPRLPTKLSQHEQTITTAKNVTADIDTEHSPRPTPPPGSFPSRRVQSFPAQSTAAPKPPQRFYTGDNIQSMQEQLMKSEQTDAAVSMDNDIDDDVGTRGTVIHDLAASI